MGSLNFAIKLGGARFDIYMSDSFVFNVPVKERLEFMTPIGTHGVYAKHTIANKRAVDTGTADADPVIALQIPGNSLRAKVIHTPEMKDLFNDLRRECTGMAQGNRFLSNQASLAPCIKRLLPFLKRGSGYFKCTASLRYIPG